MPLLTYCAGFRKWVREQASELWRREARDEVIGGCKRGGGREGVGESVHEREGKE